MWGNVNTIHFHYNTPIFPTDSGRQQISRPPAQGPVDSPPKGMVTGKMFLFNDELMNRYYFKAQAIVRKQN